MTDSRVKSVAEASYESAAIGEAMGLITDMMADPDLPQHIANGLKVVKNLLKSSPEVTSKNKMTEFGDKMENEKKVGGSFDKDGDDEDDAEDEEDLPFTGERPSTLPKKLRHSLPMGLLRRLSTSTWTTTTSATGMPTMQSEALRMRDYATNNFRFLRDDTPQQPSFRRRLQISQLQQRLGEATIEECRDSGEESNPEDATGGTTAAAAATGVDGSSATAATSARSKRRSANSPSLSPVFVKPRSMSVFVMPTTAKLLLSGVARFGGVAEEEEQREAATARVTLRAAEETGDEVGPEIVVKCEEEQTKQSVTKLRGSGFDLDEEEISSILDESISCPLTQVDQLNMWDYPIFQMSDMYKDTILTMMSYKIFLTTGLLDTFKIPLNPFFQFFHVLEMGYQNKSYHNRIHATDVLHGVYYLITQLVPGLKNCSKEGDADKDTNSNNSHKTRGVDNNTGDDDDDDYGILVRYFTPLELMAILTASAMHDYDHPGRTNAFLVATNHSLAVLYNDRSVLENHHAASAWKLFRSDPKYDWIYHLDTGEQKRFRFLVIEAILATDLKHHFEIVAEFNAKVNETSGINFSVEADKLLVSNMLIKMADINGPCKALDLHLEWTSRIHEEFFEQGDEEKSMGLPISPYMDRNHPQLAKLQDSFITHLVSPLCYAIYNARLLPGFWVDPEDCKYKNQPSENDPDCKTEEKEIWCPLTFNLKQNHHMWIQMLKQEAALKDQAPTLNLTAATLLQQQKQQQPLQMPLPLQTSKKTKDIEPIKEESSSNNTTISEPQRQQIQQSLQQQQQQKLQPQPQHAQQLPSQQQQQQNRPSSATQELRQLHHPQQSLPQLPPPQQQQSPPQLPPPQQQSPPQLPQPQQQQLPPQLPQQQQQPQGKSSSKKKNKSGEKSKSYSCSGFFIRKKQQ